MKKIIIILGVLLLLVVGGISFYLFNNRVVKTVTLDINPSIELGLDKNDKVVKAKAINEDAKKIIDKNIKGKSLNDTIEIIVDKVIENGYIKDNDVSVLVYTEGMNENEKNEIIKSFEDNFSNKEINAKMIVVNEISNQDKDLAKKYDITPAKASYINAILENNKDLDVEDLSSKNVKELEETKETGKYCEIGYSLEGDFCYKKIGEESVQSGMICPEGYTEYNDACYEETRHIETGKFVCRDEFKMVDGKCVRERKFDATPTKYECKTGEPITKGEVGLATLESGPARDVICVDKSKLTHPVNVCDLPSDDSTERMSSGGRCYWHRAPVIAEGCPGKIQIGSMCWDDATNIYICPYSGSNPTKYNSTNGYCIGNNKYTDATVSEYKCPENEKAVVEGKYCVVREKEEPQPETTCPTGYTKPKDSDRCINLSNKKSKIQGYVCDKDNSKIENGKCIIYDIKEALGK